MNETEEKQKKLLAVASASPDKDILDFVKDHINDPAGIMGFMRKKVLKLAIEDTICTSWNMFPQLFFNKSSQDPKNQLYVERAVDMIKDKIEKRYGQLFK